MLAPQKVSVTPGSSQPKTFSFKAENSDGTGVLTIRNGNGKDLLPIACTGKGLQLALCKLAEVIRQLEVQLTRPEKLDVKLNGAVIAKDWRPEVGVYTTRVVLKDANKLDVQPKGFPGSSVSLSAIANIITKPSTPPVPVIGVNLTQGFAPLAISANGFASSGASAIKTYEWNFGDSSTATGIVVNHVYTTAGTFTLGSLLALRKSSAYCKTSLRRPF